MIVPQFWAESRIQDRIGGRQVTIRRFGWSDDSPAAAQAHADTRAREALARFTAGEQIDRREPKRAYNGAEGVPIREEIVSRDGDTIITRNSYGALCLNTPNVLFADIDFSAEPGCRLTVAIVAFLLGVAILVGWQLHPGWGCLAAFLALVLGYFVAASMNKFLLRLAGGSEQLARRRLDRFLAAHPHWYVRLYRTPAGLRVLAMHHTFDPREPAVAEFFQAIGADPIYVQMCLRQNCFRARVSPKPWRIGLAEHLRPRPGVWPINPDRLPERERWIAAYEQAARGFASCQFVEALGSGRVNPTAAEVQRLHDELCQANRPLPLA